MNAKEQEDELQKAFAEVRKEQANRQEVVPIIGRRKLPTLGELDVETNILEEYCAPFERLHTTVKEHIAELRKQQDDLAEIMEKRTEFLKGEVKKQLQAAKRAIELIELGKNKISEIQGDL